MVTLGVLLSSFTTWLVSVAVTSVHRLDMCWLSPGPRPPRSTGLSGQCLEVMFRPINSSLAYPHGERCRSWFLMTRFKKFQNMFVFLFFLV